ncbi:hypothetical protein LQW54_006397 [Pestalotiopsis sp. IQ-011]
MYSPSHATEPGPDSHTTDGESTPHDHEKRQQAHHSNSNSHDAEDSHTPKDETSSSSGTTQLQHGESTTSSEEADDLVYGQTIDSSQIPTYRNIEREADTNLLNAAREGDVETLRKAIRDGASLKAKTSLEETALHLACRFGHEGVIKEILSERPIKECMEAHKTIGFTPLQWTCYQNNDHTEKIVKLLLGYCNQSDIDAQSRNTKYTALHAACFGGSEEAIKLLLNAGAEADIHDHHNSTPLTLACQFVSAKAVGMLLKAGANIDNADDDKDTPLILAAEFGDVAMIRKLLEYNPAGDRVNKVGQNAMHHAMANKARDMMVPLLLNEGITLGETNAAVLFSHAAERYSTDNPLQSMWLEIVQAILKEHTPTTDKSKLSKAIKPLLKSASREEKVFALLKAGKDAHFDVLSDLTMKELGLRNDLCTFIRSSAPVSDVFDLIYADDDSTIDGIMNKAKSTFNEMIRKEEKETMYDKEKPQLRWIHLPANHMDWMEHLTLRVYEEKPSESPENKQAFFDLVQRSRVELPTTESKIKFLKPICLKEDLPRKSKDSRHGSGEPGPRQDKNPKFSSSKNDDAKNDDTIDSDLKADDAKGSDLKNDDAKDHGPKPGNLGDSNLDGSTPEDSSTKDDHQQVDHTEPRATSAAAAGETPRQRKTKEPSETAEEKSKTIISSSTHREDGFDDLFVDRIIDQLRKGSTMGSGQKAPSSAIEMSHFLLGSCVDFINSLTWKDVSQRVDDQIEIEKDASSKPVLLFYADSLNKAMATEKDLFQDFKTRIKGEKEMARARAQGRLEHALQQASDASKALHQDTKDWTAINTAATLLDEVKDIRDELVILSLEENSIDIKESMMYRKQSATLVDLGTKADRQSDENARQEKILMLFTVVTVVFVSIAHTITISSAAKDDSQTPLSFLASFYALNTSTSRHNDDGELEYEPDWMNKRICKHRIV